MVLLLHSKWLLAVLSLLSLGASNKQRKISLKSDSGEMHRCPKLDVLKSRLVNDSCFLQVLHPSPPNEENYSSHVAVCTGTSLQKKMKGFDMQAGRTW